MMSTEVTLYLFIICLWHLAHTASYKEGETANWSFHYHGEVNMSFDIRLSDNEPFFSRGVMTTKGLSSTHAQRFHVEVRRGTETKVILALAIKDVSREDSGTYTCEVYINGEIQDRLIQTYDLHVQLPLDNSSCHSTCNEMGINGNMRLLECKAKLYQGDGEIKCYQRGIRSLPFTYPTENSSMLIQRVWIVKVVSVHCCFSSSTRPRTFHNCSDFYWNPIHHKNDRIYDEVIQCPEKKVGYVDREYDKNKTLLCKCENEKNESNITKHEECQNISRFDQNSGSLDKTDITIISFLSIITVFVIIVLLSQVKIYGAVNRNPKTFMNDFKKQYKYLNLPGDKMGALRQLNQYEES